MTMIFKNREQVQDYLDDIELELLQGAGVDNWEGYSIAYENEGDSESFLDALYAAGVDNWEWYGEALSKFGDYVDYLGSKDYGLPVLEFAEWK